jgi:hypothetical protein
MSPGVPVFVAMTVTETSVVPSSAPMATAAEPVEHWPAMFVRAYSSRDPSWATARLNYEASLLYEAGYQVTAQTWGGGGANIGDFALLGVFAALKEDTSALMVTFSRSVR